MKSLAHFHPPGVLRAPFGSPDSVSARPVRLVSIVLTIAAVVATVGCSHGREAMQKQLTELTHEVTKLRASNLALQDRVDALEAKAPAATSAAKANDAQPDGRPNLEVVTLAPAATEVEQPPAEALPEPAADESRPVIRGDESGVEQVKEDAGAKPKKGQPRWSRQR